MDPYLLVHVKVRASGATNADSDMIQPEMLASQGSAILVERCREHHELVIIVFGDI